MANEGSGGAGMSTNGGKQGEKGKEVLKKGQWTAEEDHMLIQYVKVYGHGNWNAVARDSGLMRTGKSCRLRWCNHLSPTLKKCEFTAHEERQIVLLHAMLGNQWSQMTQYLPGRTDNEIKNFWNTRAKRRQRAGVPIYPPDIQQNFDLISSSSHHQNPNFHPSNLTIYNSLAFSSMNALHSSNNSHINLTRDNTGSEALSLSSSINQPFSTLSSMSPQIPHYNHVLPFGATSLTSSINSNQSEFINPTSSEADNCEIAPELYSWGNGCSWSDMSRESEALLSFWGCKEKGMQDLEQIEDRNDVDVAAILKVADSNNTTENSLENSRTEVVINRETLDEFEDPIYSLTEDEMSKLLNSSISELISECDADRNDDEFENLTHFLTNEDMSNLLKSPVAEPISDCQAEKNDEMFESQMNLFTEDEMPGHFNLSVHQPISACSDQNNVEFEYPMNLFLGDENEMSISVLDLPISEPIVDCFVDVNDDSSTANGNMETAMDIEPEVLCSSVAAPNDELDGEPYFWNNMPGVWW